jgi:hypothetical protein
MQRICEFYCTGLLFQGYVCKNLAWGGSFEREVRLPKLLKTQGNQSREWSCWSRKASAQGRRATRLRYAPTFLSSYSTVICEFVFTHDRPNCAKTVPECSRSVNNHDIRVPERSAPLSIRS